MRAKGDVAPLILNLGCSWGEADNSRYSLDSIVYNSNNYRYVQDELGVHGGTALHVGRSPVRFPMGSFRPPCDPVLAQPLIELNTRDISWGVEAAGAQG